MCKQIKQAVIICFWHDKANIDLSVKILVLLTIKLEELGFEFL